MAKKPGPVGKDDAPSAVAKDASEATVVFGNEAREAVASLRGYVFQIYLSAVAWLQLDDSEVLHLEVAEDYAVAARGALKGVQARDTEASGSITLNTGHIAEAIDSFVDLVIRNPKKIITLNYLTTSKIGLEKTLADRISGVGGLHYWQQAAEGADMAPLRKRLLELQISERVRAYINKRDDEQLRDELISRMQWLGGSPGIKDLEAELKDLLVTHGAPEGVYSRDAERLVDPLLFEVLKTTIQPTARQLSRAGFLRFFDSRTTTQIRNSDYKQLMRAAARASEMPVRAPSIDEYARDLLDPSLAAEVVNLRRRRFFAEARTTDAVRTLADQVMSGRWRFASATLRSEALGWVSRLTINDPDPVLAQKFCEEAKKLQLSEPALIAEALITWRSGDKGKGLKRLSDVGTSTALGAALVMYLNREGWESAEVWRKSAGLEVRSFSADGIYFYILQALVTGKWEAALAAASLLTPEDFDVCPALHRAVGIAQVGMAVPNEFRSMLFAGAPFSADTFDLSDKPEAQDYRRAAIISFEKAAASCEALGLTAQRDLNQESALWLRLRFADTRVIALEELKERLNASNFSPRWLNLALRFGIKVDQDAAELELDRQTALQGGIDGDLALARFALALASPTAQIALQKMARYRDALYQNLNPVAVAQFEIQFLVQTGQRDRAQEVLQAVRAGGISQSEDEVLASFFSEDESEDPAAVWIARYEKDGLVSDLQVLVATLERSNDTERLSEYAGKLFEETRSAKDAERYSAALDHLNRKDELNIFLESDIALTIQSKGLAERRAWSLFQRGDVAGCRAWLSKAISDHSSPNIRALRVALAIASGKWADLRAFLEEEYAARNQRTPRELVRAARLAVDVEYEKGRDLLFAAAENGSDDAACLAAAFDTATKAGWDDAEEVSKWLLRAADLSGDDGPVQRMSVEDVVANSARWQDYAGDVWLQYQRGKLPTLTVARSLNRSLIDLTLRPATANEETLDPRGRQPIPAFHGGRPRLGDLALGRTAVFEPTALLTLAQLGLLPRALSQFDRVVIAHSSLGMFFQEKQRAAYHQPSQAKKARDIQQLVLTKKLQVLEGDLKPSAHLLARVGRDTAVMFAEARALRRAGEQCFVVRPGPIYSTGAFLKEKVDLTEVEDVLSGCAPVVAILRERGVFTEEQFAKANAYLSLHEEPWPKQPLVQQGCTLLLDELGISYLGRIEALSLLKDAGFIPKILRASVDRAIDLTTYNARAGQIVDKIEEVRRSLSEGIENGTVLLAPDHWDGEDVEEEHQTLSAIQSLNQAELLVSDDRHVNELGYFELEGATKPVLTTVDLIEWMARRDILSHQECVRMRTKLRRSGFAFVPVDSVELDSLLKECPIRNGAVLETAELRAIRENLELLKMSVWLQWPDEAAWLQGVMSAMHETIKIQWIEGVDPALAAARSAWVLELMDLRDWAPSIPQPVQWTIEGRAAQIGQLIAPVPGWSEMIQAQFLAWVDEAILLPLKENEPELFASIVARVKAAALRVPS